jgi:hypothetical protein
VQNERCACLEDPRLQREVLSHVERRQLAQRGGGGGVRVACGVQLGSERVTAAVLGF